MQISRNSIESIKKNIPIKKLVQKYIKVKNNRAVCPFHDDKDPSMYVYPESNNFKCFGCGAGGDVIEFIERIENIDFIEAVKKLSNSNHIQLEYESGNNNTEDFLETIKQLKKIKHEKIFNESILEKYDNTHQYLLDLGFSRETIKRFQIGYCADQNDTLFNRITIPWRNTKGQLVGIVGRDVTDKSNNKYIAKKGTKKRNHLYNLNNAKKWVDNGIIIVEDEKSVWRLWEWGFYNAIALGCSTLKKRKFLLRKFTNKVYLCLDNDKHREENLRKIISEIYFLFDMYVIKLKKVKDIAEMDDKYKFKKYINSAEGVD